MNIRLERELFRWIIRINGGNQGWDYVRHQATLHAFSISLFLHPAPNGKMIKIGNAQGYFDAAGEFHLGDWGHNEIFCSLLQLGEEKVVLDNPELNQALGNPLERLPNFLSKAAKERLEIGKEKETDLLKILWRYGYSYVRLVILADFVANQVEEMITQRFKRGV